MLRATGIGWALKNPGKVRAAIAQRRFQRNLRRRGVKIGPGCMIAEASEIGRTVELGRGVLIQGASVIGGDAPIRIGNYTGIATGAQIRASNYDGSYVIGQSWLRKQLGHPPLPRPSKPVTIGACCWIGTNALILSGVEVGHGAFVGAGAVVTKDVPPYAIAVGNPARVVGKRFDDAAIEYLLDLAWWDWSLEELRRHPELFTVPLTSQSTLPAREASTTPDTPPAGFEPASDLGSSQPTS